MLLRTTRSRIPSALLRGRGYATRGEFERPKGFDIKFKPYRAPFFSWKSVLLFGVAGAYLAYSEVIFEKYAEYTEVDHSELLPIQLEFKLKTLPIYQRLTKTAAGEDWVMMKSYENLDRNALENSHDGVLVKTGKSGKSGVKHEAEYAAQSLTSHTLAQPGGIAILPVVFHNRKSDESITIVHMGYRLCGYPFIVHGGMLATLLNETFKRNASLRHDADLASGFLKDDYKVENLSITYRRPAFADQFFIVKTHKVEDGELPDTSRLARYTSVIESEKGDVLVHADAVLQNTGRATHRLNQAQASRWALF
ncbi:hypothetical protein HF325_004820 [Metschnikowia pulcherrima]|uniref:Uncharacterized protein n=1 Tax=Metschnikowia pulcherrima TaxID=27326 RepID=A0A8H7L8U5_9ASCO|nr:hypothetical protein HF325_004820 [Metschnikowia pulcherrima]